MGLIGTSLNWRSIDQFLIGNWDRLRAAASARPYLEQAIRKYTGLAALDEIKAEEYRYWRSRPVHERIDAVSELTQAMYAMKRAGPDVPRLQRTLVRFERVQR